MNRKIIFIAVSLVLTTLIQTNTFGQAKDINVDELRTPSSPGFILMDEAPASIEKPSTPQGLALNLLSLKQGGALEFSPYWLRNHPKLKFDDYVNEKLPILKTISLSISTVTKGDTLNLAAGLRTHIFRWRSENNKKSIAAVRTRIETELDEDEPKTKELREELERAMRPTLLFELAGSYLGTSSNGSYDSLKKSRLGIWVNASIRPINSQSFEILLLSRYLENPDFKEYSKDSKIWDAGIRLLYSFNRIGVSAEYVQRKVIDSSSFNRVAGILEYKIGENLYATGTFGKNFNETSDIIALFGLNIGFASKTSIK